jgi:hypothetical protein
MSLLLRAAALVARVWEAGASGATAIRGRAGLAAEGLGAAWRGEVGQSSIHRRDPPPLRVDDALGALAFGFAAQAAVQITAVEAAGLLRTVGILRQSLGRVNGNVLLNERPPGRIHAPRRRLRDSHQLRCNALSGVAGTAADERCRSRRWFLLSHPPRGGASSLAEGSLKRSVH